MDIPINIHGINPPKKILNMRKIFPHNSRNILSILFDEVNLSEEKFDAVKKGLQGKHHCHQMMSGLISQDIFCQNS